MSAPSTTDPYDDAVHEAVEYDASGLEVLSEGQCLDLLRQRCVGRVVFTAAALPAILPVSYAADEDGSIVLRTGARTRLAASAGTIVAFEADAVDAGAPQWSVVVTGQLSVVRDPAELARVERLDLKPWTPVARHVVLRVIPELVTGRRVPVRGPLPVPH